MELVYKQMQIAVPRMRLIGRVHGGCHGLIVTDLVANSQQLRVAWPSLSIWKNLRAILTRRLYLRQL